MARMRRENVHKRGAAWEVCSYTCNRHCDVWPQFKMALFVILLFFVLLQADLGDNQRLSFWVKNICNPQEQVKNGESRNPYSMAGCNMTMICEYRNDTDCEQRTSTNLTVKRCFSSDNCTTALKNVIIPENNRTKCEIAVLFVNMTKDMQGIYFCEDSDLVDNNNTAAYLERHIKVGYSPLKPLNISFVYQPQESIGVILNPQNTSQELRAKTTWDVTYNWTDHVLKKCRSPCQRQDNNCKSHLALGFCMPCSVRLSRYAKFGQYANMGSIIHRFKVEIQVWNIFNKTDPVIASANLLEWVKPGPVHEVGQLNATSASVHIQVIPPLKTGSIDVFHLSRMKSTYIPGQPPGCPLWLTYTVSPFPAKDQSMRTPESILFFQKYGFMRNLEDDQRAFGEVKNTLYSKNLVKQHCWDSSSNFCPQTSQNPDLDESTDDGRDALNPICFWLENLTRADFLYNVTFKLHSRYSSDPMWTNVSTAESVPERGPELDDNFAYCPSDSQFSNDSCSRCLIYFKEIPQVWRGGRILHYSLTLELVNGSQLCGESNQTLWTNGSSNTFFVPKLSTASEYKITLIAHNKEGPSPATVRTFVAQPSIRSSVAPRNVIVEKGGNRYKLTWKDGPDIHKKGENDAYFVHYCYASQLEGIPNVDLPNKSNEAQLFLNCLTNMVTKKVPANNLDSYTLDEDIVITESSLLKPAFFISISMEDERKSGLVGVDCFYYANKYPEAGSFNIVKLDDEPTSLNIIVSSACGGSVEYRFGQPDNFVLARAKTDSDEECSGNRCNKVAFLESKTQVRIENPKKPVVERISGLDADTQYCIGISVGQTWSCQVVKTAVKQNGLTLALGIGITATVIILAVLVIICYVCIMPWYHQKARKFGKSLFEIISDDRKDPKSLQVNTAARTGLHLLGAMQGEENPVFSHGTHSSFSSEVSEELQSFPLHGAVRSTGRSVLTDSRRSLVHRASSCSTTNHHNAEENTSASCSHNQGEDDSDEEIPCSESDGECDHLEEEKGITADRYFKRSCPHADNSKGGSNNSSINSHSVNSGEDDENEKDKITRSTSSRYPAMDNFCVNSQDKEDTADKDTEVSEDEIESEEVPISFNRYARHNTVNSLKGSLASDVEDDGTTLCVETKDVCGRIEFGTSALNHPSSAKMFNCESLSQKQSAVSLLHSNSSDSEIDNILKAADNQVLPEQNICSPNSESQLKVAVPTLQHSISSDIEIDAILNAVTKGKIVKTPAPLTCESKSNFCADDPDTLTQPDPSLASTLFVDSELNTIVPAADIDKVNSILEAASLHPSGLSDAADVSSEKDTQEERKTHNLRNPQDHWISEIPNVPLRKTFLPGRERVDSVSMARQESTAVCFTETIETNPERCRDVGEIPSSKQPAVGTARARRAPGNAVTKSVEDILNAAGRPQTDLLSSLPALQRLGKLSASHGSDRDSLCLTSGIDCDSGSESCNESSNESSGDHCALISSQTPRPTRPASLPATDTSLRNVDLSQSSKTSASCTDNLLTPRDKKIQGANVGKKKLEALICKVPNTHDSSDENNTPLQSECKPLFTGSLNSSPQGGSEKERLLVYENLNHEHNMYMKVTKEETRL